MRLLAIEHVQLAMPAGGEAQARAFYQGILGLTETPKPAALAQRGGCWFEQGSIRLHLGVEADFRPAKKAHPALLVDGLADLRAKLEAAGFTTRDGEPLEGFQRFDTHDPFGNRVEFIEANPPP